MENGESVNRTELLRILDEQDHTFFKLTYLLESHTGYLHGVEKQYGCFNKDVITGFWFTFEALLETLKSNSKAIEQKARQCKG
jgi:hypothetical protein